MLAERYFEKIKTRKTTMTVEILYKHAPLKTF